MWKFPNVATSHQVKPLYTSGTQYGHKRQHSLDANIIARPRTCHCTKVHNINNNNNGSTMAPLTRCKSQPEQYYYLYYQQQQQQQTNTSTTTYLDNYNHQNFLNKIVNLSNMYEPVANNYVTIVSHFGGTTTETEGVPTVADDNVATHNNNNNQPPEKPPRRNKRSRMQTNEEQEEEHINRAEPIQLPEDGVKRYYTIGVQVTQLPPYRLRVLPKRCCTLDMVAGMKKKKPAPDLEGQCCCDLDLDHNLVFMCFAAIGRCMFSQCGLVVVIVIWALLGAAAFHETEGPREREQAEELATLQYNLAMGLATELRQIVPHEPVWLSLVQNYFAKHETLLLNAVSSGYGEGGGGGQIWTYPGCLLFAVSLLTTLGFGAPVPRTTLGRGAAVLFSAIGIPLHFLLVLNVGVLTASKLQAWATRNSPNETQPKWFKYLPVVAIISYYSAGVVLFGLVRQRDFADSLLFPLDFTATGGVAKTLGHVRILYAMYLELAVTLAAVIVALLQVSASRGIVHLGLKFGLLTNA